MRLQSAILCYQDTLLIMFIGLLNTTSLLFFFFSSRRRHTRSLCDWSSDVCSSDLLVITSGKIIVGGFGEDSKAAGRHAHDDLPAGYHQGGENRVSRHRAFFRTHRVWRVDGRGTRHSRSEERRVGKEWRSRWATWP